MFKNKMVLLSCFFIVILFSACGDDNDGTEEIVETKDTIKPTITCNEDISIIIDLNSEKTEVVYATPVGIDNLPGAVTTQSLGLESGSMFPLGTTTNTFLVTDAAGNTATCSFDVTVSHPSENTPYGFENGVVVPDGKKWAKVENLSDEFNANSLDEVKWKNTDPSKWVGRAPGLFKKNTVSVANGNLQLTSDKLLTPEVVNGKTFTHEGSYIASNNAAEVGYYFECRMKANKTFMSSTFWLINNRNDGVGCDQRVTELDIQECVGEVTNTDAWAKDFDKKMSSNTHSRNTSCNETPIGSVGGGYMLYDNAFEGYHVYAAWWKSPTEIEFFLDGKKVFSAIPKAEFNLKMYLRMVVETYDWNPVPADGGMTGNATDRTTYYDWVRTWKLENE